MKRLPPKPGRSWRYNVKGKALFGLWRMKPWLRPVLTGPVLLILAGCTGFNSVGVSPDALPPSVSAPCPHPFDVIQSVRGSSVGSDELRMGRLGDALIECSAKHQLAVEAYDGVRDSLTPPS